MCPPRTYANDCIAAASSLAVVTLTLSPASAAHNAR